MLYFGIWRATFPQHIEDYDLFSINTLVEGEPKFWYCIPPMYAHLLEKFVKSIVAKDKKLARSYAKCNQLMRHKTFTISPEILEKNGIPYSRIVQHKNETIITTPYCYHGGFNTGFNVAEARNFATQSWLPYGKTARVCFFLGLLKM